MGATNFFDHDFILTISDNEELPVSDESASEDLPRIDEERSQTLKRKHTETTTKSKQKKHKRQRTNVTTDEAVNRVGGQEDRSGESEDDGVLNPDFEFELGISRQTTDIIDDFDGWGESTRNLQSSKKASGSKRVDIEDIIARRSAKKDGKIPSRSDGDDGDVSDGSEDEKTGQDVEEDNENDQEVDFPDFEEDELLATDRFGGGAVLGDDDGGRDQAEISSGDEEDAEDDEESPLNRRDAAEDSDSDSVASPTAHPDDLEPTHSDSDSATSVEDAEEAAKREAFFAPDPTAQPTAKNSLKTTNAFTAFSLSRPLLRALTTLSFSNPTPIQTRTIPLALAGHDVVGSAVTGSGKTAAFLLPILERLLYRPRRIPTTRVSILTPTRELAIQCHTVATQLAKHTDITFALLVGGLSLRDQETALKRRPDIVIATPGRFIDHMRNSASFAVEHIEILVLDEADRMLDDGFADELDEIIKTLPKGRQTMLFSATMTDRVDRLVRVGMTRPVRVSVDKAKTTTGGLVQEFVRLRPGREGKRLATLAVLCQQHFTERTIIFVRQKHAAHRMRVVFALLGLKAGELHGSMSQEQRLAAVSAFRDGRTTHLLATDLASRGLDIRNVQTVVNFEAPASHEIYLHRVGRTARAGREGRACTIAAEEDRKVVKAAVKAARAQGARVVSRAPDAGAVDAMHGRIAGLEGEVEAVLREEREERQLAQVAGEIRRGENLVEHQEEILSRPRRTWFESEREKGLAKLKGTAEYLNEGGGGNKGKGKGKLSNKDKKRLDVARERKDGKVWRKGKGSEVASLGVRRDGDKKREKLRQKLKGKKSGGGGGGGKGRASGGKIRKQSKKKR